MEKRSEETIVEGEDSDDEEEGHNYNVPPKTKSHSSKKEARRVKAFSNHMNNKNGWNLIQAYKYFLTI